MIMKILVTIFCELNDRILDNFDWLQNDTEQHLKALQEFATIFYQQQRQRFMTENPDEPPELFEETFINQRMQRQRHRNFLCFVICTTNINWNYSKLMV